MVSPRPVLPARPVVDGPTSENHRCVRRTCRATWRLWASGRVGAWPRGGVGELETSGWMGEWLAGRVGEQASWQAAELENWRPEDLASGRAGLWASERVGGVVLSWKDPRHKTHRQKSVPPAEAGGTLVLRRAGEVYRVQPSSTSRFWPLTYLDMSESRNNIAPSKSSGSSMPLVMPWLL